MTTGAADAVRRGCSPVPACAGIGLRFPHHEAFLAERPAVGFVEVHSENYLAGPSLATLEEVGTNWPISLHSVGLSLGAAQGLDARHLARLVALTERIDPILVSEHLAWGAVDHAFLADLLPLPLTDESLAVLTRNIDAAQTALKRRLLIENPSTYLQFRHSTIPEPEFLAALVAHTGCGLICDVNNVFVSASNHGWDAVAYLRALPAAAVAEYHLAGHSEASGGAKGLLLDTHDHPIDPAVWKLFELALGIIGPRPTLIEWDAAIPPLSVLCVEAATAEGLLLATREVPRDNAA